MANEGIMALPLGAAPAANQSAAPSVSATESYDAAQTALGMVNPQAQAAAKAAVREAIGDLQLSPEQLDMLIQVFTYVSQNPADYEKLVQKMIEADILDPGDFPEKYDPEFIGVVMIVLEEMRLMREQGTMDPMMASPAIEGMAPAQMAGGGLADVATYLASKGRGDDTILAHINPEEAALLKRRGGSGMINSATGLPEFGFLSKLWKGVKSVVKSVVNVVKKVVQSPIGRILATVALAMVLGPAGVGLTMGTAAGVASAGVTLAGGGSLKQALVAGAMGYFGGGGTIMGASPIGAIGQYLPGAAGGALNTGLATGIMGAGVGKLAGMSTADALKMGLTSGVAAGALQGMGGQSADLGQSEGGGTQTAGPDATAADMVQTGDYGAPPPSSVGGTEIGTAQDLLNAQPPGAGPGGPGAYPEYATPPGAPQAPGATGSSYPEYAYPEYAYPPAPVQGQAPGGSLWDTVKQGASDMYDTAGDFYNENISPNRPGLAADAGLLTKYGPMMAAGTAISAATGGMKKDQADQNPLFQRAYTGSDFIRDNPDKFQGGLDFSYRKPATPQSPIVPAPSFNTMVRQQQPSTLPMGITNSPAGVAQPYNVAGMYGVPLIYGQPPVGRAHGGEMTMRKFPPRDGPIQGPGTGTSDDIPAMLSDGEFVFTAKAVRNAGGGSRRKGAARMYKLMKKLEGGLVKG